MSIFGNRLKKLRGENNLTQTQLSKNLGVAFSTISMYERGERNPDFETMEAIADYFNVTIDYLLGKTDIPNSAVERIYKVTDNDLKIALWQGDSDIVDDEMIEDVKDFARLLAEKKKRKLEQNK